MKEYRTVPRSTRTNDAQRYPQASRSASSQGNAGRSSAAPYKTQAVDSFHTRPANAPAPRRVSSDAANMRTPARNEQVTGPAHASSYRAPAPQPKPVSSSTHKSSHRKHSSSRSRSSGSHVRSIIAMALGISSVVVSWAYLYGSIYSIAAGIVALCLAKADAKAGVVSGGAFRKTAKITGIIGICCGGVSFIVWLIMAIVASAAYSALGAYY